MSYAIEKSMMGRKPLTILELDLDYCRYEYGQTYTNLLLRSEQLDNATWAKSNVTVTVNDTISPSGAINAEKIQDTSSSAEGYIQQTITVANDSQQYVFSCYLKAGTATDPVLYMALSGGTGVTGHIVIDLDTEKLTKISTSDEHGLVFIGNGWYRAWVSVTNNTSGNTTLQCRIQAEDWGLGGIETGYFYGYGAQCVAGSTPGHYVLTTTVSASAGCDAAGSGDSKCYNTRKTCADTANYTKQNRSYRFCQPRSDLPKGISMYPCIKGNPNLSPVGAPVYGVGDRGKVAVTFDDFPHNDRGTDPYVDGRTYDPLSQGTFFGKLFARNPYYVGRTFRVKTGFITNPFSWANFQNRTYITDKIEGPDTKWRAIITGADILRLTDKEISKVPLQTTGTYVSGLTSSPLTINIAGDDSYDSSGEVRIGDEVYQYTGKSLNSPEDGGCILTGITRASWGSTQEDPDVGDTVELCKSWSSTNVVDIVYEMLNTYVGIDASNIPYNNGSPEDEWDIEKVNWLSGFNLTTIITEPTGVNELLEELAEQCQFSLFVDQINDKIKLITNTPPLANESVTALNDDSHFRKNSLSIKEDTKRHYTRVLIHYDKRDYTKEQDVNNFKVAYLNIDTASESADLYNTKKEKVIYSRWFDETNSGQVILLASRLLSRFTEPPKIIRFSLDAKDSDLWTGDLAEITSRIHQEAAGCNCPIRVQVLSVDEDMDKYHYVTMSSQFVSQGRYGFIKPSGSPKVDYSDETETNQDAYAHIVANSGEFPDGEQGYKII